MMAFNTAARSAFRADRWACQSAPLNGVVYGGSRPVRGAVSHLFDALPAATQFARFNNERNIQYEIGLHGLPVRTKCQWVAMASKSSIVRPTKCARYAGFRTFIDTANASGIISAHRELILSGVMRADVQASRPPIIAC